MARRGELGMDRQELAKKARVDPKTLYWLETGQKWPIAVTRAKVEKALGWASGEMERIRAAAGAEPEAPDVLAEVWGRDVADSVRREVRERAPQQAEMILRGMEDIVRRSSSGDASPRGGASRRERAAG